jgi:hypothetical protein
MHTICQCFSANSQYQHLCFVTILCQVCWVLTLLNNHRSFNNDTVTFQTPCSIKQLQSQCTPLKDVAHRSAATCTKVAQRQGWDSDDNEDHKNFLTVQLEAAESYDQNACRKVYNPQAAWVIANDRGLEYHVPMCSVCFKISHWQRHLSVMHVEHNLLQTNFKLVTVYVAGPCTDSAFNTLRPCYHDQRKKRLSRYVHY